MSSVSLFHVADGVGADLESVLDGQADACFISGRGIVLRPVDPAGPRRLEHPGPWAPSAPSIRSLTERTVSVLAGADDPAERRLAARAAAGVDHGIETDAEPALLGQLLVEVDRFIGCSGVMKAGDAFGQALLGRQRDHLTSSARARPECGPCGSAIGPLERAVGGFRTPMGFPRPS